MGVTQLDLTVGLATLRRSGPPWLGRQQSPTHEQPLIEPNDGEVPVEGWVVDQDLSEHVDGVHPGVPVASEISGALRRRLDPADRPGRLSSTSRVVIALRAGHLLRVAFAQWIDCGESRRLADRSRHVRRVPEGCHQLCPR